MAEIDFDKLREEIKFDDDPKPASPIGSGNSAPNKSAAKKAPPKPVGRPTKEAQTTAKQKEVQEEIEGFLAIIGVGLTMQDKHPDGSSCGDLFIGYDEEAMEIVMAPQGRGLAIALAKLDNKYVNSFFASTDSVSKYLALAMALQPFAMSVASAHMNRGVKSTNGADTLV